MEFMKYLNIKNLFLFSVLSLVSVASANAVTIIQVHLGGLGNGFQEIQYVGSGLSTINDGDAATTGNQDTDVVFDNLLSGITDIASGASFTLSGIVASGAPTTTGPVISQSTTGGTFSLYDAANTLLLSGTLGDGFMSGSETGSVGSLFTTTFGNFNGGTLLPLIPSLNTLYLSLILSNVQTAGAPGMDISASIIQNFSANGQVSIDAELAATPEPFTLGLLLTGTLVGSLVSRRKSS